MLRMIYNGFTDDTCFYVHMYVCLRANEICDVVEEWMWKVEGCGYIDCSAVHNVF